MEDEDFIEADLDSGGTEVYDLYHELDPDDMTHELEIAGVGCSYAEGDWET